MIELSHLTKRYGSKTVVDDLSTVIPSGSITGFIGPNGAGKTTTISMICGILKPNEGNVSLNGINMLSDPLKAKKEFCLIPDSPDLFLRLSAKEYIDFLCALYGIDSKEAEERTKVLCEEFDMTQDLDVQMKDYSHGMRQKALLIASLVCNPDIWILDEPMTGLDPSSSYLLKQKMKEEAAKGKTVFFSTHILEVAEALCDKILLIFGGKLIYDGTLEDLKASYPNLSLEQIYLNLTGQYNKEGSNL